MSAEYLQWQFVNSVTGLGSNWFVFGSMGKSSFHEFEVVKHQ